MGYGSAVQYLSGKCKVISLIPVEGGLKAHKMKKKSPFRMQEFQPLIDITMVLVNVHIFINIG